MQKRNNCSYLHTATPPLVFILPRRFQKIDRISTTSNARFRQGLTTMNSDQSQRGRPRGTGIDDSGPLREIAALIAADPDLRPTTAIKNIGIFDPSTIRRLRDKFNKQKERLLREIDRKETRCSAYYKDSGVHQTETRTMALNSSREPTKSEAPRKESASSSESNSDEAKTRASLIEPISHDALLRMLSASLRSASTIFQLQLVVATQSLQSPAMRSALRYQLAFSQAMLGFGGPQPAMKLAGT